jgi:hypothetical protein
MYIRKDKQLRIIVLEDMQSRIEYFKEQYKHHDIYFFDSVIDCINAFKLITDKPWDIFYLSHDLNGTIYTDSNEYNTGYTVAKYLSENDTSIKKIIIHSANSVGAEKMKLLLPQAEIIPFTKLNEN